MSPTLTVAGTLFERGRRTYARVGRDDLALLPAPPGTRVIVELGDVVLDAEVSDAETVKLSVARLDRYERPSDGRCRVRLPRAGASR